MMEADSSTYSKSHKCKYLYIRIPNTFKQKNYLKCLRVDKGIDTFTCPDMLVLLAYICGDAEQNGCSVKHATKKVDKPRASLDNSTS